MTRKPLARYWAVRALAERARPTLDLLADASGLSLTQLRRTAEREGWALDRAPLDDVAERLRVIAAGLLARAEAIAGALSEEGGKIDKAEIDALLVLIRSLEKIGEIMRPQEADKEKQIKQDEDLAAVLRHIDDRIVELARELAAQMVAKECGDQGSGSCKRRVGPGHKVQAVSAAPRAGDGRA